MAQAKWDKVADQQFMALDKDWQADWNGLRERVNQNR